MSHLAGRREEVVAAPAGPGRWSPRRVVGSFLLWTSGIHVGIVAADTGFYRPFADAAVLPWVYDAWQDVFLAAPVVWGLAVAAGELAMGLLLLRGGIAARVGWCAVIAFHVLLVLFGWGFLFWSAPGLAFLVVAAVRDWPRLAPANPPRPGGAD